MPDSVSYIVLWGIMDGMWLTSQNDTIIPHPAERGSLNKRRLPTSGGMHISMVTRQREFGKNMQPRTPVQIKTACTVPDGAVKSIVWNLS